VAVTLVPDPRAKAHIRRWEQLYTDLSLWMPTWQDLTELILPRKANVNLRRSPGRTNTERMMDATAAHALELLAASMQGSLTSQAIRWFYYRVRGIAFGEDPEMDVWLESTGDAVYDELKWSNFSAEAHEFYTDLGCLGTAAMYIEKREPKPGAPWQGLRFKTLGPGTYAIGENEEGRVDTLYYKYRLGARQCVQRFGMEKLPDEIKRQLTSPGNDPDRQFEFIHCVYPRQDKWVDAKSMLPSNLPFASLHISLDYQQEVKESGYHEFPFAVGRWTKSSDEKYGRSPGYTVLADIKTLNKLVELKLRALANKVYPPMKVRDDGVLGTVKLSPGALTHVRDMEAVEPLLTDRDGVQVGSLQEEKMQAAIRRGFFSDQLQLQEGPQMTAYEVQVRYELMQRILGPTLGRLEVEFLEPVITRGYRIMERAQRFTPPPASMMEKLKKQGRGFDIEYEGPLQRAQRLGDVVTIQRCFQLVLPLVQPAPQILDNFDLDAAARVITKNTGAPAIIIRSEDDVKKIRADRAAQEQQAKQAQSITEGAKAAGSAAPALKALVEAGKTGALPAPTPAFTPPVTGGVGG
jgi:hypothetical protein